MAPVAKAVETLLERLNKVIEDPPKQMEMRLRQEPPEIIRPLSLGDGECAPYIRLPFCFISPFVFKESLMFF